MDLVEEPEGATAAAWDGSSDAGYSVCPVFTEYLFNSAVEFAVDNENQYKPTFYNTSPPAAGSGANSLDMSYRPIVDVAWARWKTGSEITVPKGWSKVGSGIPSDKKGPYTYCVLVKNGPIVLPSQESAENRITSRFMDEGFFVINVPAGKDNAFVAKPSGRTDDEAEYMSSPDWLEGQSVRLVTASSSTLSGIDKQPLAIWSVDRVSPFFNFFTITPYVALTGARYFLTVVEKSSEAGKFDLVLKRHETGPPTTAQRFSITFLSNGRGYLEVTVMTKGGPKVIYVTSSAESSTGEIVLTPSPPAGDKQGFTFLPYVPLYEVPRTIAPIARGYIKQTTFTAGVAPGGKLGVGDAAPPIAFFPHPVDKFKNFLCCIYNGQLMAVTTAPAVPTASASVSWDLFVVPLDQTVTLSLWTTGDLQLVSVGDAAAAAPPLYTINITKDTVKLVKAAEARAQLMSRKNSLS